MRACVSLSSSIRDLHVSAVITSLSDPTTQPPPRSFVLTQWLFLFPGPLAFNIGETTALERSFLWGVIWQAFQVSGLAYSSSFSLFGNVLEPGQENALVACVRVCVYLLSVGEFVDAISLLYTVLCR